MCLDFEVRSLDLKKGKFEEIGETPYQKPLSKPLSKTPSKNPSKCKAFSLRSKIMPFKENLISLRATGFDAILRGTSLLNQNHLTDC